MAGVRQSTIRNAVADALTGADFHRSTWGYELFGREPKSHVHRSYAVGIPDAERLTETRRGQPWEMDGTMRVRMLFRRRQDAQDMDDNATLDGVEDAVGAIEGCDRGEGFHLWYLRHRVQAAGDGTYNLVEIDLAIRFQHFQE